MDYAHCGCQTAGVWGSEITAIGGKIELLINFLAPPKLPFSPQGLDTQSKEFRGWNNAYGS